MGKFVYIKNKKVAPHQPGHWSEKKHLEVVTTYLALGNLSETSRVCNVPIATVKLWKSQQWWKELVESIQSGENQKTDNKMSKIIDKALDLIVERMEHGDYQYDQKTGKMVKVPLKARDLERVTSGLFDKRSLIRKEPTAIKAEELKQAERLVSLAKEFAKLTNKKVEREEVINEYIEGEWEQQREEWEDVSSLEGGSDAVHDQWKTQLQEGIGLGEEEQAQQSEGSSAAECSESSSG